MAIPNHIKNNLSIPVIGSPLFLVSGPELVIAQCKAGIIGSFPALNARPQHVLGEWITRIKPSTPCSAAFFACLTLITSW